jgi:hypothetical protein
MKSTLNRHRYYNSKQTLKKRKKRREDRERKWVTFFFNFFYQHALDIYFKSHVTYYKAFHLS